MVGPSASVLTAAELSAFGSRTSRVRARFGGALTWGVRLDTAGTVAVLSSPSEVAGAGGGGAAAAMDGSLSTGVAAGPRSAAGEATSATRVGALPATLRSRGNARGSNEPAASRAQMVTARPRVDRPRRGLAVSVSAAATDFESGAAIACTPARASSARARHVDRTRCGIRTCSRTSPESLA